MTAAQLSAAAGVGAVIVAVLARWPGRFFWRMFRGIWEFLDDWQGEAARPGVRARAGVMERLATLDERVGVVEAQVKPNGGTSMHDAVNRIEQQLTTVVPPPEIHIHTEAKGK